MGSKKKKSSEQRIKLDLEVVADLEAEGSDVDAVKGGAKSRDAACSYVHTSI